MPTSVSAQTTEIVPITPLTVQNEVTHVCACVRSYTRMHVCTHTHIPAYFRLSLVPLPLIAYPNTSRLEKKNSKKKIECEGAKIDSFICYVFDGSAIQVGNAMRSLF